MQEPHFEAGWQYIRWLQQEWKCDEAVCLSTRHVTLNSSVICMYTYTSWQAYLNHCMKIMPRENFISTNVISVPLQYQQGSSADLKWRNHSLYNNNSIHWRVRSFITNLWKMFYFYQPNPFKKWETTGICTSNWSCDDKIL